MQDDDGLALGLNPAGEINVQIVERMVR